MFDEYCAAEYAYWRAMGLDSGFASDAAFMGQIGGIPAADFYIALSRRFAEQHRAVRGAGGAARNHWKTLEMLAQPLGPGKNARATRDAMFVIINDIIAALELLAEFSAAIHRAWAAKIKTP